MNNTFEQLFNRLKSPEMLVQVRAVAELAARLEQNLLPSQPDVDAWEADSEEELVHINISEEEEAEVMMAACAAWSSEDLLRSTKISLFWAVTRVADLKYGDLLLRFFADNVATFDEQETFSSLAVLTLFVSESRTNSTQLAELLKRHDFEQMLFRIECGGSARLQDSVRRLLRLVSDVRKNGI